MLVRRLFSALDTIAERRVLLFFGLLMAVAAAWKYLVMAGSDGGEELRMTYIPKTLMLMRGQNPYSVQVGAAPYPPFLFLVLGGIIRLTFWNSTLGFDQVAAIGWNIRLAGLVADLLVGALIFLGLRAGKASGLGSLIPPAVFLLLPSVAHSNYYWFHADVFGYLILAGSLLALVKGHTFSGVSLLSLAVVFKLQPILSLPLVLVWMVKRQGFLRTVPGLLSSLTISVAGLVVPLLLSGYLDTLVGFNLSYGSGDGMVSFTLMNLFNGALPLGFGVTLPPILVNEVWVSVTVVLFLVALGIVWTRGGRLDPLDVVLLGLLAWLIPLRTLYPYYLVWAFIPLFFKGNIRQMLVLGVVFEAANILAVWSWNILPDPFPLMNSVLGYFVTSLAFAAWGFIGAGCLWRSLRNRALPLP